MDTPIQVIGEGGLHGTVRDVPQSGTTDVELDTGQRLTVPVSALQPNPDGTYRLPLSLADIPSLPPGPKVNPAVVGFSAVAPSPGPAAPEPGQSVTIPVVQEQLHVIKEKHETGKVVVQIVPQVRSEHVHVPLTEEHVEINRVPVNEFVTAPKPIREEGDTTIVPVYEEVLVVERKLRLREEIHIRRQKVTRDEDQDVPLRTEEVHILRSEPPHDSPPAAAT